MAASVFKRCDRIYHVKSSLKHKFPLLGLWVIILDAFTLQNPNQKYCKGR